MIRPIRHAIRFTVVLTAVFLAPGQIRVSDAEDADALGGKTLMTFCAGKADTDLGVCNGYILGVAEAMNAGQTLYGAKACNHDGIKSQQLVDLVRMDLNENPALQNQKAGQMVARIMEKSFPCYNDYAPAAGNGQTISVEPLPAQ